jgi:hypothetical protein
VRCRQFAYVEPMGTRVERGTDKNTTGNRRFFFMWLPATSAGITVRPSLKVAATAALLLVAVSTLALAAPSVASRAPTPSEREAILQAAPGNPYPTGWAHRSVRVSSVDSKWAAVFITANPGHHTRVQPDFASMYHTKHHGWVVHQLGNGGGCRMPAKIRIDLRLFCV